MAFCVNCGTQLNEGASFCPNCGSPIQAAQAQAQQPSQQPYQQSAQQGYQPSQRQAYEQPVYQQDARQPYQQPAYQQQPYQQPIYQQPYQQQPYQQTRPVAAAGANPQYQKLGGFLLVLVVLEALSILSFVSMTFQSIEALSAVSSYGGEYVATGAISVLANLVGLAFAIGFVVLLVKRNPSFLRFFQLMDIASMAISLVSVILTATMLSGYGAATLGAGIVGVILGIVVLILFTMYFCKSERMRTYMGSTAYIDRALFKIGA